eukprot:GHVT01023132.1.p1 GENE.GHVT01023132.1~~GHVT01023132.1.p1  ORF type:complete len:159 (+),score=7.36 GHVT01023132.1:571-1047(+)
MTGQDQERERRSREGSLGGQGGVGSGDREGSYPCVPGLGGDTDTHQSLTDSRRPVRVRQPGAEIFSEILIEKSVFGISRRAKALRLCRLLGPPFPLNPLRAASFAPPGRYRSDSLRETLPQCSTPKYLGAKERAMGSKELPTVAGARPERARRPHASQ